VEDDDGKIDEGVGVAVVFDEDDEVCACSHTYPPPSHIIHPHLPVYLRMVMAGRMMVMWRLSESLTMSRKMKAELRQPPTLLSLRTMRQPLTVTMIRVHHLITRVRLPVFTGSFCGFGVRSVCRRFACIGD
jgi:hypothetical protein